MCIESGTNKLSRLTQANEDPNDLKDQLCALTEGLRTLARIVTMADASSEYYDDLKHIEELQSEWRLEDTGFSALYNACKQMKDTLCLTSLEANEALIEVQTSRRAAVEAKNSQEKTKKKLIALEKENSELRNKNKLLADKLREQKKQKKLVARSVRNFFGTLVEEQAHACDSEPTEFSDTPSLSDIDSGEEEWEEISNSPSSSSLVTDGCATLRLAQSREKKETFGFAEIYGLGSMRRKGILPTKNIMIQKNEIDLSFPTNKCGILYCAVQVESSDGIDYDTLLVRGLTDDFDESLNRKPLRGSRLVCIDGVSLEREHWAIEKIVDYIASKNGPLQMSFRNEILTKTQIKQLSTKLCRRNIIRT